MNMVLDDYRKRFDKLFENLDENEAEKIDESTLKIIDHVHTRVSYTEDKRKAPLEISLGLLALSGLIVLVRQYLGEYFVLLLPFLLSLIIVAFLDISLYLWQERFKRPFIETARTWRWFYHYCINPSLPVGPPLTSKRKEKSKQGYLEGLFRYAENTLNTTSRTRLRQDIEQLFILLTTERLKNEFLKRQQGVLIYGLLASLIALLMNAILPWERLACLVSFRLNIPIVEFEFRFFTSLLVFLTAATIFYMWKVFPVTKSREPWEYLVEPKGQSSPRIPERARNESQQADTGKTKDDAKNQP